jgi:hypothetical protein
MDFYLTPRTSSELQAIFKSMYLSIPKALPSSTQVNIATNFRNDFRWHPFENYQLVTGVLDYAAEPTVSPCLH